MEITFIYLQKNKKKCCCFCSRSG